MKKIFFILSFVYIFSLQIFAKEIVLRENLTVNDGLYYYQDELYSGKAVNNKDRYYFKDGRPTGKWIVFYKNNNIKSIINWKNGKLNGKYIVYQKNGIKNIETNYKDGKEDGKYTIFYQNGKARIKGYYSDGNPVGNWEYFDKFGKLTGKNEIK